MRFRSTPHLLAATCAAGVLGCFGSPQPTRIQSDTPPETPSVSGGSSDTQPDEQVQSAGPEMLEEDAGAPMDEPLEPVSEPEEDPLVDVDVTDDLPASLVLCDPVRDWDPRWSQFEDEVVFWTNEARAQARSCGSEGDWPAAPPLAMETHLRCAARLHSSYMAEVGDDFNHETRQGIDPFDRIDASGYLFREAGENIAVGQETPEEVVQGWIDSDGHCRNLMDANFIHIGVGYAEGIWETEGFFGGVSSAPYWTQNFASPL